MDDWGRAYNLFDALNERLALLEYSPTPTALLLAGLHNLTGDELEFTLFDQATPGPAITTHDEPLLSRELGRAA